MFYSCTLFHICFLKWFWFPFQFKFLQNDISLCPLGVQLMMAYGMLHVASARPASADVIFYLSFLFYSFIVLGLLSFSFWKVCIKGVHVRVYVCVYVVIMDIILSTAFSGWGQHGKDELSSEGKEHCMYLLFVCCIFNLFKKRGIKIKKRGHGLFYTTRVHIIISDW